MAIVKEPPQKQYITLESAPDPRHIEKVLRFIEKISQSLHDIFNQETFRFLVDQDKKRYKIDSGLFIDALEQTRTQVTRELQVFRSQLSSKNKVIRHKQLLDADATLKHIGFTGYSYELKIKTFEKLRRQIPKIQRRIIDFAKRPVVVAVRSFLECVNSLLGSLAKLIPGLDGLLEVKDIGEGYLGLAEASDPFIEKTKPKKSKR